MPQATNLKMIRNIEFCPVGPGTVLDHVVHISSTTRERASIINKTEETRFQRIQRIIDKEQKYKKNIQERVIQRTSKTLKEKMALLHLLGNEYKFNNFITTKRGFDSNRIDTKEDARRYVIETRIFHSGFNLKSMKPEVHRKLRNLDPNNKYRILKKKLLTECREKNVEINRKMSNSAFYRMLRDTEHKNGCSLPAIGSKLTEIETPETKEKEEYEIATEYLEQTNMCTSLETRNDDAKVESDSDTETEKPREQSVVLEKRLARPRQDAFSTAMKALGPVYFQTTVQTISDAP